MKLPHPRVSLAAMLAASLVGCAGDRKPPEAPPAPVAQLPASNPFATPSTLPFGAEPFDRIQDADYEPALDVGMAQELAEIQAIADDPAAPSFDNTITAMEKSGQLLGRVQATFQNMNGANTDDVLDKVNEDEAPKLQAHNDQILLNAKLFQRVKTLHDQAATLGLDDKQKFLLDRQYKHFVRAGAELGAEDQARLKDINGRIASLEATYRTRLVAATDAGAVVVSDKAELAGLGDAEIAAAADAAKARHLDGKYVLALQNTTQQPLLASLKNRELRHRLLAASEARGSEPGPTDLRDIIATLAQLRAQRARILGFPSYSAYVLDDQMAKSPERARALLAGLVPATVAKARREASEIQAEVNREKRRFTFDAADWSFYADKVRHAKYALDDDQVRPYFELERVREDGVFFAANQLYGVTFKRRTDIPVWNPDVKVWEVFDADGKSLALYYADNYIRPNKSGGAWCNLMNVPSGLEQRQPIIVNVTNFTRPADGQPALISFDDVTTLFHEFGHALHAMFSVQYYPDQEGFDLPTDVIEFPSQFNEHWALDPTVLAHYAKHYKTGKPMPKALVDKIKKARTYGQGYAFTELLEAALLDLDWHALSADAPKQDPAAFEAAALKQDGFDLPQVPPRYKSPYFLHIWGNGYQSNYYSYTWGEILDDDAFEWFTDHGGLTRANGQRFRDLMLGPGFVADPMDQYRNFRGRDPSGDALKRNRGL
jgi:peptidyl-dipeptidase Dcp